MSSRARTAASASASGLVGLAVIFVIWELLALFVFEGQHVMPTPVSVVRGLWDQRTLLRENTGITLVEAGQGWLWGNGLAIGLALVFVMVPAVEAVLLRLAITSYCLPTIAIAPILNIVFTGDRPKVYLAALSVFFTTLIGMASGLRSPDASALDLVRACGGTSWTTLMKVRLRYSLPSLFAALRIAAPAALLGAIIGEYLGGTRGIGVAMINSEQSVDVTRTWTLAAWATILAGAGYCLTSLVGKWATPWAANLRTGDFSTTTPYAKRGRRLYRTCRSGGFVVLSIGLALGVWLSVIKGLHLNTYFAKSPLAVWKYVTSDPMAAANRATLWHAFVSTLQDSMLGFAVGTAAGVLLAIGCVMVPQVEAIVMPIAIAVRSVPLVAMTPLFALAFGRGILTVTLISSIVTFFPTFVNMVVGLRSPPSESLQLMRAFDASPLDTVIKLRLPTALPALFASARIAGPSALTGAVLAEYLATGKGLGYLMLVSDTQSQFSMLWASVVLVTLASIAIYAIAGMLEQAVMRWYAGG